MFTLNCRGKLVILKKPAVMGIINATPDSFYKGDLPSGMDGMLLLAEKMITEGATFLDIGGQSTRPGSTLLTADEELKRIINVVEEVHRRFPETLLSVDTFYSYVAEEAVNAGASIINDISAGNMDVAMPETVAKLNVPYICMHMQGTPQTMQQNPAYENVITELLDFFIEKIKHYEAAGIKDIIIDPGFGFGKTTEHNFKLLKNLSAFKMLEKPILAGLSRKSMIYRSLGITAAEALNGTTALNMAALQNGATILRVHDVKEAVEVVSLYDMLNPL